MDQRGVSGGDGGPRPSGANAPTAGDAGVTRVDVLIVGAGISGIGAACRLHASCPGRSYAILEGRPGIGGTWDLFRYPGIRSDSDMHTLGFDFKPWTAHKAIADGPSILAYLDETVDEFCIRPHIRFDHRVKSARWDSASSTWSVLADNAGREVLLCCNFLFVCAGYYSYRGGHDPWFAGREQFGGAIVHPQQWPAGLDYRGKKVVVIGSGATAMTIVPSMARDAAHVTMVQRTPTYVVARPDVDVIANGLRRLLPAKLAYGLVRWKNTTLQQFFYRRMRAHPERARARLVGMARKALPAGYPVDTHFAPAYKPWDQRLCLLPNGDLFEAIAQRRASIVTGAIERFTPGGVQMASGEHIDADIIVTATGLDLVTLGEMEFSVDGVPVDFARTVTYKGFAYSGVPNLASSFGYINASWTLRSDLIAGYVCRLLNHMQQVGATQCTPTLSEAEQRMPRQPWITGFSPGYLTRVMHLMPRQLDHEPWTNPQDYRRDRKMFRTAPVDDGAMRFARGGAPLRPRAAA
jgi:cation diffusion facilitator CzcD-associated flavoprotein CzcO